MHREALKFRSSKATGYGVQLKYSTSIDLIFSSLMMQLMTQESVINYI